MDDSLTVNGCSAPLKGCTIISGNYVFFISVLGTLRYIGSYKSESVKAGARLHDALQLLLYGPRANTTFEWSAYTQADILGAAKALKRKGIDVRQAVLHAREAGALGKRIGVIELARSWTAYVAAYRGKGSCALTVCWKQLPSAEVAAQQADCGLLAVQGLGCTTNFPPSMYSKLQLEQAGEHAVSMGVDELRVTANLEAVEKLSLCQQAGVCRKFSGVMGSLLF
jgi:hypothetical protein